MNSMGSTVNIQYYYFIQRRKCQYQECGNEKSELGIH